ncbi:hypothetical protein BSKO_08338 [Bryopsis sp. KO-2023]|nr:hypothetical protein BSKO_08338 [Bryopsis sp. KO-2023]
MPRELVTLQVGQCGNQIGYRFWDLALREHAAYNKKAVFDESLSSFFRNVDTSTEPHRNIPVGTGRGPIESLKARCLLIDMEEGVVNEMLKAPIAEIFDHRQLLTDVSGSGNNWAHGHNFYGPKYRDSIGEKIRATVEECDSLQCFLMIHSLGGGTGSGLGSYILEMIKDEYPEVYRFALSVFPSEDDDVVTSPYNAMMSASSLIKHADCVLPVENQALMDICTSVEQRGRRGVTKAGTAITGDPSKQRGTKGSKPFDAMNGIAANLVLNLTSSVRFEGPLNVDLNEITMNLVPFPGMHFLVSSMSPLIGYKDVGKLADVPRSIDQVFRDVFSRENQLAKCDPVNSTYLACGLFLRGSMTISDINRNCAKIRPKLRFPSWNTEGFKLGMCAHPPIGIRSSALCLSNNTCIVSTFSAMQQRFQKLYKRKVYLHHYAEYMDPCFFDEASESMLNVMSDYARFDGGLSGKEPQQPPDLTLKSVGLSLA